MPDIFDTLLNNVCDILAKGQSGSPDSYGIENQSLIAVVSNWPCRQSTLRRGGQEQKSSAEFSKNNFIIFMRPPSIPVTAHHWIKIGSDLFNVLGVNDPSRLGHHLEVSVEQVMP